MKVQEGKGMPSPLLYTEKLNLGCGREIASGYINVDRLPFSGVNVVCDLNNPLPFTSAAFGEIRCFDILEHVVDLIAIMAEIARVLQPGGLLIIRGPKWGSWNHMVDPTHYRGFLPESFDYFDPDTELGRRYSYGSAFHIEAVSETSGNLLFRLTRR